MKFSMNLNHLRYFYAIAEVESVSEAAQKLNIQQPALSKTLRTLEADLGQKLFSKKGRGIQLTDYGKFLYGKCHGIFSEIQSIEAFDQEHFLSHANTLSIYTDDAVAAFILPELLKELQNKVPDLRPIITTGKMDDLVHELTDRPDSIGLFFHKPSPMTRLKIFTRIPVKFRLVVSSKLAQSPKVISNFIGSREVHHKSNSKFPTVVRMRKNWKETKIRISSNSMAAHKAYVLAGLGSSILPEFLIKEELQKGILSPLLPKENFIFDLKVVVPQKSEIDPDFIVSYLQRHL